MEDDGIEERVGESSWPSAAAADRGASSGGGGGYTDIRKEIFDRLMAKGMEEVVSDPGAEPPLGRARAAALGSLGRAVEDILRPQFSTPPGREQIAAAPAGSEDDAEI